MAAVLVAAVALLFWAIGSMFGGGGSSTVAASSSPTASPPATSGPSPSAAASASTGVCKDTDLAVTVAPAKPTFPVGSQSTFVMKVANKGQVPCTRDVGPKNTSFTVTSGGYRVWSSDDCSPGGESKVETIPPGQAYGVQATWNQEISLEGCPSGQPAAKAGSYSVTAASGSVTSPEAPFQLTD